MNFGSVTTEITWLILVLMYLCLPKICLFVFIHLAFENMLDDWNAIVCVNSIDDPPHLV